MSLYLNQDSISFKFALNSKIYIDKTLMIREINSLIQTNYRFMCVTRPRRFGKSMALSMLNAYYSKGCDSKELFKGLKIENDESYLKHLNKHNVLWIDMADLYTNLEDATIFVKALKSRIFKDLKNKYPDIVADDMLLSDAIKEINNTLGERFIFLIDEWDVIFREEEHNYQLCDEYIKFLRGLFKSRSVSDCIDLVYMTGILPIKRYSTQSTLNMFSEYNMVDGDNLTPYFGFTENEVKYLCAKYNRDFNEIKEWYDGYKLNSIELYNPKSVVDSLLKNKCGDYWTKTSSIEAITDYMNYDNGELKDIIAAMMAGEKVPVNVSKFQNDLTKVNSRDAALTVLIHLGYLAYDELTKSCYIPNYEISLEFENALEELKWDEIYNPISNSKTLYSETLKGNTEYINQIFDLNHKSLAGPFNKNKEDILGIITLISYYSIRRYYDVHKEVTSILGRADIMYIPRDNTHIPLIIELKVDSSKEECIKQIKTREYFNALGSYKGDVLLLGITYNTKTLKHDSMVEIINI